MTADAGKDARTLDLRGLKCPLPALRTRKALAALAPGESLDVSATDPMAAIDIPHLVRQTGDYLEGSTREDGVLRFVIRKA
jgi:TusA-related sulfurtransferase